MPLSKGLRLGWVLICLNVSSRDHNSGTYLQPSRWREPTLEEVPDLKLELFPVHSPLLRESSLVSFPPLIDMLKFGG